MERSSIPGQMKDCLPQGRLKKTCVRQGSYEGQTVYQPPPRDTVFPTVNTELNPLNGF